MAATPSVDGDALAREEALRQQQAALQMQIKSLGDQIAALRVQATSLAARNQALEGSAFSPALMWLLIALAVIAIVVAGWMAWRYTQLRRSLEGSAWWTSQAVDEGEAPPASVAARTAHHVDDAAPVSARPLERPARPSPRAPATAVPAPDASSQAFASSSSATVSNVDRIRPPVRAPGSSYPAAMDTDFTVSDIEAAMATVRTVSPPRTEKAADPLHDSDFSGLAGPSFSSPFSETPPSSAASSIPNDLQAAEFVDLDIPHIQPLAAAPARTKPDVAAAGGSGPSLSPFDLPLDFNARTPPAFGTTPEQAFALEFPGQFDPLATDSMKTTIFDRRDPEPDDGLPANGTPTALDFELPSQTQIVAMTTFERSIPGVPARHGATALNDLFAPDHGAASDTILDLNDRDGTPLSGTEVDRLTSPTGGMPGVADSSGRSRMAGFADLMTRVDDLAIADPLAAIADLRRYVLRDERIPTLLWLRLFELYKVVDKRPVYEALAEHFARRYHRPMVAWTQSLADRTPQRPLSALSEIDRQIESQWGTGAGAAHLETLLCDRTQDDAIVFNAVLQADLLDAAKIYPVPADDGIESGPTAAGAPG